jgi:hypothetical protein
MDRARSSELSAEQAEAALRELPEIEVLGLLRRASNYTFLVRLGPPPGLLAVYKPAAGESPLWDFDAGTLYKREVAAYRLAKQLGWPRVPPTVVRETAPHGIGALQLFIEADLRLHYLDAPDVPEATWEEVALFDVIVNNADRKAGHCLSDGRAVIWVIDHGLTFHTDYKLRTVIWEFAGRPLPGQLRPGLERALESLDGGTLREALAGLLSRRELAALRRRVEAVLAPGWCFPEAGSAWSLPWPPV